MMTKDLNRMCLDCPHLGTRCTGTHNDVYSGCVWKADDGEHLDRFNEAVDEVVRKSKEVKS